MKQRIIKSCLPFVACYLLLASRALAAVQIKIGIPGLPENPEPNQFVGQLYQFAIMISGVLALGAIVFGGVKYMTAAGNPSGQSEGREWIKGAVFGLLLLFGAYLILNVVNPDITKLSLPTLAPIPVTSTGGGGVLSSGLADEYARRLLTSAGVGVSAVSLDGVQQSTIDELINLKRQCNCEVSISSVTGGAHSAGQCSHAGGFKADIRPNSSLDSFITRVPAGTRQSDGAPLYRGPAGLYADERTRPPRCGASCGWTGPHWDTAVGC